MVLEEKSSCSLLHGIIANRADVLIIIKTQTMGPIPLSWEDGGRRRACMCGQAESVGKEQNSFSIVGSRQTMLKTETLRDSHSVQFRNMKINSK